MDKIVIDFFQSNNPKIEALVEISLNNLIKLRMIFIWFRENGNMVISLPSICTEAFCMKDECCENSRNNVFDFLDARLKEEIQLQIFKSYWKWKKQNDSRYSR